MKISVEINGKHYHSDMDTAYDLSIHINDQHGPRAWFVSPVEISPVVMGDYVGDIKQGSPVNFMDVTFNPHGNGTHTECVDHIADIGLSVCEVVPNRLMLSELITVEPTLVLEDNDLSARGDLIITPDDIRFDENADTEALIIRTLPNLSEKTVRIYSGTNPCYFHPDTIQMITESGIKHLLIDLPSVDKEDDGGKVLAHHAFWNHPKKPQLDRTITELIYADNFIQDGIYLLNLQVAPFKMDASPSRPIIYPVMHAQAT